MKGMATIKISIVVPDAMAQVDKEDLGNRVCQSLSMLMGLNCSVDPSDQDLMKQMEATKIENERLFRQLQDYQNADVNRGELLNKIGKLTPQQVNKAQINVAQQ